MPHWAVAELSKAYQLPDPEAAIVASWHIMPGPLVQYRNCRQLRHHDIIREDFWVRDGRILNPEKVFFDERQKPDIQVDCKDAIIAPGFIEVQINGTSC